MTVTFDAALIARRFGYGPAGVQADTAEAALAGLEGPDAMAQAYPMVPRAEAARRSMAVREARKMKPRDVKAVRTARIAANEVETRNIAAALARIVATEVPLRERLVWFWADHFTARSKQLATLGLPIDMIETVIRPNLSGHFATMLVSAETHPAMVAYLDQGSSAGPDSRVGMKRKQGLNENLAREIMELHTLGVGAAYTQADVRQLATLLTGLVADPNNPFRPGRAEPGADTVLGVRYGGKNPSLNDITAVLNDLAARPETAAHLSRKLAVHFVADEPPPDLVDALTKAWLGAKGNLSAVYRVLVTHPAGAAPEAEKARQPFEFIAASMRALGLGGEDVMALDDKLLRTAVQQPLALMGQPFMAPEGPNGWDEETATWLTPQGIGARIVWSMRMPGQLAAQLPEPAAFLDTAVGPFARPELATAVARAPSQAEAVGLVLASPEFNMR